MNIRQLQYFLGVIKEKSITKAAAKMYIAQPALGLQVRKLEEELGVELVVRHSRGVSPTEAGIRLARHAEVLIRQFERARQDMLDYAGDPKGRVIIGLTTSTSFAIAGDLVARCQSDYPEIRLKITEGLSENLMEWVLDDRLDMTLTYNPAAVKGLASEPLVRESLYFVQSAERPRLTGKALTLERLLGQDLMQASQPHEVRMMIDRAAHELGIEPNIRVEVDSVAAKKELIRRNLGSSIMPYTAVQADHEAGAFDVYPITSPLLERTLFLAHSEQNPKSKAFLAVAELVRSTVRDVAERRDCGWTVWKRR